MSGSCFCGESNSDLVFRADPYDLVTCRRCGQARVKGSRTGSHNLYEGSDYFVNRNEYLHKRSALYSHFRRLLRLVSAFIPGGKLLEVGCSVGILLEAARDAGFEVSGVEISPWASSVARSHGFQVITGELESAGFTERSFQVVILNHVLEHLPNPNLTLAEVSRILADDGLLVVGVPNFGSFMARFLGARWASLLPEEHIWQFTRETLQRLLEQSGFKVIHFEARENHTIGLNPLKQWRRFVNLAARLTDNAEAMLVLAVKSIS